MGGWARQLRLRTWRGSDIERLLPCRRRQRSCLAGSQACGPASPNNLSRHTHCERLRGLSWATLYHWCRPAKVRHRCINGTLGQTASGCYVRSHIQHLCQSEPWHWVWRDLWWCHGFWTHGPPWGLLERIWSQSLPESRWHRTRRGVSCRAFWARWVGWSCREVAVSGGYCDIVGGGRCVHKDEVDALVAPRARAELFANVVFPSFVIAFTGPFRSCGPSCVTIEYTYLSFIGR